MKRKRKPAGIYKKFNINMCPSPNGMAIDIFSFVFIYPSWVRFPPDALWTTRITAITADS